MCGEIQKRGARAQETQTKQDKSVKRMLDGDREHRLTSEGNNSVQNHTPEHVSKENDELRILTSSKAKYEHQSLNVVRFSVPISYAV